MKKHSNIPATPQTAAREKKAEHATPEQRSAVSNGLLRLFLWASSRNEFVEEATRIIRDWCGCDCAGIRALDEWENIPYVSHIGFGPKFLESECWLSLKEDQCACIRIIGGRTEPQDIPTLTEAGSYCCNDLPDYFSSLNEREKSRYRGVCLHTGYKSIAIVPIRYGDKVLGAVHLTDTRPGVFPPQVIGFVESLTPLIGEAIYRFHVEDKLQRNYEVQKVLNSLLRLSLENLTVSETLERALDVIHSTSRQVFGSRSCVFLVEGNPGALAMKAQIGVEREIREGCARVAFGECLCGKAALTQQVQFSGALGEHQDLKCTGVRAHKHYSVPIVFGGATLGVMHVNLRGNNRRDPAEEENLTAVANTLAGILVRKKSEEELRNLSRRLLQVQEEERRSIGRELHDEIGQSMTVLMLALDAARHAPPETAAGALAEAQEVADEVMMQVRHLSLLLHSAMLEQGLLATLRWYFERYGAHTKLRIHFQHSGLGRELPREVTAAAYRIIQESLTNVVRHARVSEVKVQVRADRTRLHLRVEDHGPGFDAANPTLGNSTGLQGMRERASFLGGRLEIKSAPGAGACVTAEFPLK
ncbi:MAG: GAF domain-containing sensor histidine kinase [Chloroflexi bacterium]|nr:GAF domain-containing sensor histidine kinase [Chloroflexota bacterium]